MLQVKDFNLDYDYYVKDKQLTESYFDFEEMFKNDIIDVATDLLTIDYFNEKDKKYIDKLKKMEHKSVEAFQYYTTDEGCIKINGLLYSQEFEILEKANELNKDINKFLINETALKENIADIELKEIPLIDEDDKNIVGKNKKRTPEEIKQYIKLMTLSIHYCPLGRKNVVLHRYSFMDSFLTLMNYLYKPLTPYYGYDNIKEDIKKDFENKLKNNKLINEQILNLGFLSTSLREDIPEFCKLPIHYKIYTNEFTKGIFIKEISKSQEEDELLIQRRQIFKILKSKEVTSKYTSSGKQIFVSVKLLNIEPKEVSEFDIYQEIEQ